MLLILTTVTSAFILNDPCPAVSPCRCYGTKVDCIAKSLDAIPVLNFTAASRRELYIDLRRNVIYTIGANALGNIDVLQLEKMFLNLDDNKINDISDDAFDNLGNASVALYLNNNDLSSFPRALSRIWNLKELHLFGNQIMYLDDAIMTPIGRSLQNLWLNMGSLAVWPRSVTRLVELTELVLHYIPFHSIPETAFDGLLNIERLEMHYTKLRSIPKALCGVQTL